MCRCRDTRMCMDKIIIRFSAYVQVIYMVHKNHNVRSLCCQDLSGDVERLWLGFFWLRALLSLLLNKHVQCYKSHAKLYNMTQD